MYNGFKADSSPGASCPGTDRILPDRLVVGAKLSDLNLSTCSNLIYTAVPENSLSPHDANVHSTQRVVVDSLDGRKCHTEQLRMSSPSLTKMPAVVPDTCNFKKHFKNVLKSYQKRLHLKTF